MSGVFPGPVRLTNDERVELTHDIETLLGAIPQLERLAKYKLKDMSPDAARALDRLKHLRDTTLKGV